MKRALPATFCAAFCAATAMPAQAATCDAANQYNFSFSSQAAATLAYGSTYTYTATRSAGGSQSFTVSPTQNGLTSTFAGGEQLPAITTLVTGPSATQRDLVIGGILSGRTSNITSNTRVMTVTFTFAQPVVSFSLTGHDIDFASNQFRDWVNVSGANGPVSYVPGLVTPWGNNNAGTSTNPSSSIAMGPRSTTPVLANASQMAGVSESGNNSDTGTFTASFAQPVTSVTVKYGNFAYTSGESSTGQQAMGISGISFCQMPSVTMTKTSTPDTGSLGAFNIPGNDVIYSITVTNTSGTSVDANSIIVTDLLPTGVTFRNAPFDGTTTGPVKLAASGGLTFTGSNLTFRQSSSPSFGYTPASGYDAQVGEIRIAPGGQLDANSSATFQFKARVN